MPRSGNLLMGLRYKLNKICLSNGRLCPHPTPSSHLLLLEIGHQVANELISPLCPVGLMNIIGQMFLHIWWVFFFFLKNTSVGRRTLHQCENISSHVPAGNVELFCDSPHSFRDAGCFRTNVWPFASSDLQLVEYHYQFGDLRKSVDLCEQSEKLK